MVRKVAIVALVLPVLLAGPSAAAFEIEFTTANDFLASNPRQDDLYTFSVLLGFRHGKTHLVFWEHAFTDRENRLRFDESYFSLERTLPILPRWNVRGQVGVLYVGEGIFGESAQNAVHELLGDSRVELPYLDQRRFHATAGLRLSRAFPVARRVQLRPEVELHGAAGFSARAVARLDVTWRATKALSLKIGVGERYSHTEFAPLQRWVKQLHPVAEIEVGFRDLLFFAWNYNAYGTGVRHWRIDYRWEP